MDKRPASRARTMMKGRIVFNNRSATLDCIVRNMSKTGAKIEVSSAVTLPERFELLIPHKGETRRARIVWRKEGEMGIAFETRADAADRPSPMAERLKKVEEENGRLRKRIAELIAQASEV